MSNDNHPTDKPAQAADAQPTSAPSSPSSPSSSSSESAPTDAAKPVRKIVRRSGATRDNAAFAEAPAGEAAPPGDAAASSGSGGPASAVDPLAPRPRATFDARAPRPAPRTGPSGGPDARRPGPRRPARTGSLGGDFKPPPGRPVGARPIPGGPRAPVEDGAPEDRPRQGARHDGDFRPPPARPLGARPLPGGSRAPAPGGAPRSHADGARGERGDRPRRDDRPREDRPRNAEGSAGQPARVAPAPKPAAAPEPAPKATKAAPIFIPLARAGQITPPSAKPALTPKEALAAKIKAQAAMKGGAKPAAKSSEAASATFDAAHVNATPAEAVEALVKAGDAGAALVDAWASASNAAAIVEAAEAEGTPSAARKAARRALNILRSRGVAIPERQRPSKVEERTEAEAEAMFTAPDSMGSYVISVSKREPSGRLHLAEVMIREPFGILQAYGGWVSASQLKEARGRQAEGYGVAPVAVPTAWARALVARGRKLNATSGQVLPLGYDRCAPLLEPAPEEAPAHPVADLEGAIDADTAIAAAKASGQLHAEPEFRGWSADRNAINELLMHLGTRLGPQGKEMGKEAFDAALAEEIAAATDRFFSPEVRQTIAGRMRDGAISVRARKGDKAATDVLAVVRAITDAGLITSPPREIPFLRQFFELGLRAMAQQTGGELRVPLAAP